MKKNNKIAPPISTINEPFKESKEKILLNKETTKDEIGLKPSKFPRKRSFIKGSIITKANKDIIAIKVLRTKTKINRP